MGRHDDNAPIGNTCPKIDTVIRFLEKIDWDLDNEDEKYLDDECKEIVEVMEEIRRANQTLREWGNATCVERDEREEERDYLEKQVKNLTADNESYEKEIEELKFEIEELDNKPTESTNLKGLI